jgi:magnesium transporter
MTVNCYLLAEGPLVKPCEYSFAIDAILHRKARIWIDILDTYNTDLEKKLYDLNVNGLIRQLCLDSRDHPGFYPFKPLTLMVIPVQMEVQALNVMEYLSIIFSDDFLFSIRNSKMARFRKSISASDSFDLLPDDSIAGLIATWMLGLSLDCLKKTAKLNDIIMSLEKQMEDKPDSVKIEKITGKRSELLTLESIVQGQLPIIETTLSSDRPSKSLETTLEYLRWAVANLRSADRKLEWLEHRIEVMSSLIDMYAQDKTNRRLGRLTVLSAIFMPITFLAGIWGMNFKNMPTISLEYGFVIAILTMAAISWAMYLYFRKKGWFD